MNATLLKAMLGMVPACMLLAGALRLFCKARSAGSVLQLLGAGALAVVIFAHVCEGLRLFPAMGWGLEHSTGHYLDLGSAVAALALFPLGYLLQAFTKKPA